MSGREAQTPRRPGGYAAPRSRGRRRIHPTRPAREESPIPLHERCDEQEQAPRSRRDPAQPEPGAGRLRLPVPDALRRHRQYQCRRPRARRNLHLRRHPARRADNPTRLHLFAESLRRDLALLEPWESTQPRKRPTGPKRRPEAHARRIFLAIRPGVRSPPADAPGNRATGTAPAPPRGNARHPGGSSRRSAPPLPVAGPAGRHRAAPRCFRGASR